MMEAQALFSPGGTVVVYGLWIAPAPRRLESYFNGDHCVWLAADITRLREDGTPGNLRPLPLWAPSSNWPVSEYDREVLSLLLPFYQKHARLISSSHARGIPIEDALLETILIKLRTYPFLYGEGRRPIEIRPDMPLKLRRLSPWSVPLILEMDGTPVTQGTALFGQNRRWAFQRGVFRPLEEESSELAGEIVTVAASPAPGDIAAVKSHPASKPRPRLTLHEDGDRLIVKLNLCYGTALPISPADSRGAVVGIRDGEWGSWPRDPEAETAILLRMNQTQLEAQINGVYLAYGDAALDFLLDEVPLLIAESWEILGEERLKTLRVSRQRPKVRVAVSSGIDWFEVRSELAVDGNAIAESYLKEALGGRSRYVRLDNGSYARLPLEWLARQRSLMQSMNADSYNSENGLVWRLPAYLALVAEDLLETADDAASDAHWKSFCDRLIGDSELAEQAVPDGFVGELRPYQRKGLDFLCFLRKEGLHGILADEMGLGKTIQAIALLQHEKEAARLTASLLVVPTSVLYNWERELARFAPALRTLVLHGAKRCQLLPLIEQTDVVITSYALLRRDLGLLRNYHWYFLLLDEAQNIKNAHSQSARAARSLRSYFRLCLTGTPLE
ncbi:MAG: SNF2 helicase associated domain-containing protein, partial [Cyanobacteria bacterium NC_groundwater_1444_Ag_S-0.65um_54_12]|nr:SNF2 helicase associated domain-containing protein [Cyanobacteria bacterium NC_groundwater_1444_Ag_S-0.65um_54_12]